MLGGSSVTGDPDGILRNGMDVYGAIGSTAYNPTRSKGSWYELCMNYAWAIEFVELTRGTWEEQERTSGSNNFYGLHGNAILAKCAIQDPVVLRNEVGPYFPPLATKSALGEE